ncbi:hypothetical protein TRVL_01358 [Trypanosoma vivax]|nr:hypothetical protein TRVL_01358 [Trypanosoma vivax]
MCFAVKHGRSVIFYLYQIIVAFVDVYILHFRVGAVWRRGRNRVPSMERGDLVLQLSPQCPLHKPISGANIILSLNESFLQRSLWNGLRANGSQPSAVITSVLPETVGFYTSLNLMLCGFNVHGIGSSPKWISRVERAILEAVERQRRLHKEWVGRTGRFIAHVCDMSNLVSVSNLCTALLRDTNIRVIICNAEAKESLEASSSHDLDGQFTVRYVSQSLLLLRLLQHRLVEAKVLSSPCPHWRIVVVTCSSAGMADSLVERMFNCSHEEPAAGSGLHSFRARSNAEMSRLLFGFALSKFVASEPRLAPFCSVNIVQSDMLSEMVNLNADLSHQSSFLRRVFSLFSLSPVVAALHVTDVCLGKRVENMNGHYFRMGEDVTAISEQMQEDAKARMGCLANSPLFNGVPKPAISLSREKQKNVWICTLSHLVSRTFLKAKVFY